MAEAPFIEERTAADDADLGPWMARLFQVLNTPPNRRSRALDEDLARFPHVNGELFAEALRIPDFDAAMRQALLDAGQFDWTAISPAIFGALFQSVMEPAERRAQGAHYTTEKNILKVIEPLFLDDLRAEFQQLRGRWDGHSMAALRKFRDKLGALRLFDPTCGCGNFLIIAYRELRTLEIEVLRELASRTDATQLQLEMLSVVEVDQFYGIEIGEFPARIAYTRIRGALGNLGHQVARGTSARPGPSCSAEALGGHERRDPASVQRRISPSDGVDRVLGQYGMDFYDRCRPHSSLNDRTPDEAYTNDGADTSPGLRPVSCQPNVA